MLATLIIILGYINDPAGELAPTTQSRLDRGFELWQDNPQAKILLTGGFGAHFNTTDQPHAFYAEQYLLARGVPLEAMIYPYALSANTVDDARKSKPILEQLNPKKIFLVTSSFHLERARFVFTHIMPQFQFEGVGVTAPLTP